LPQVRAGRLLVLSIIVIGDDPAGRLYRGKEFEIKSGLMMMIRYEEKEVCEFSFMV